MGRQHASGEAPMGKTLVLTDRTRAVARAHLTSRTLVTPNERAASALRGAAAEGMSLASWAEDLLLNAGWTPASEVAQLNALRRAAREVGAMGAAEATVNTLGAAVRELLRAGLGETEAVASGLLAAHDLSARTKALARVALRYREVLAEDRLVDPAEALWRAALLDTRPLTVLVAGYPRVGLAELVFLDAVAGPGSVFVLPTGFGASQHAAAELGARGWSVEDGSSTNDPAVPSLPPDDLGVELVRSFTAAYGSSAAGPAPGGLEATDPRLQALRLPSQEDEVRYVLTRTKELLRSGVGQGSITLIARDERLYGPLVEAIAWEYAVPVKLSYEVPLRGTRLGELMAAASAAIGDGLPFEATARLLAHPLLRALDAETWTAARRAHPSGVAAWNELTPVARLLEWPEHASVDRYLSSFRRLFDEAGVAVRLSEREARARRRLEDSLAEHDQLAVVPLTGFLALLDELLAVLSVSLDPPSKRGVEFHTPLAVFGASYQHVFIMGAAEGLLPAPLNDDPLLDFLERGLARAHGLRLEDALEASERESLSFMAAVATAASSLTLSYPELLENREQLPSPFFTALGVDAPSAPGPRPAASEGERLILALRDTDGPARHAWQVETRRESDAPPDVFDGIIGMPVDLDSQRFSASQLTTLGQCAFRWFAQRRLRLAEPDEADEDVSPALLGSLYHKTLELVTRGALGEVVAVQGGASAATAKPGWSEATATAFRAAAVARLDDAFTAAQAELGAPTAASWPLRRREHLEKLTRVIRAEDFLLPLTEVVRLEGRFQGRWRGFPVSGFVDRVDDGANGLVLTDYKTGKSLPVGAKNSRGEPKLDLQLPLYVETAAPAWFGAEHAVASARYFSLNGATTISVANIDEDELQRFVARTMTILAHGDFPVDPDEEQKVCTYCVYDAVCRRGPRLGRKRQRAERESAAATAAAATDDPAAAANTAAEAP